MRNHTQHPVDMMTLGFTKVAGFHPWLGYDADFDWNYNYFWKSTIRAQQHMNGDDVIGTLSEGGGYWEHGKQEEKLFILTVKDNVSAIETQYYISNNKESIVGYVRNRTYNIHTTRLSDACTLFNSPETDVEPIDDLENIKWNDVRLFPLKRRLRVQGLKKNTNYRIDYYSYETGNYLSTQCDHTSLTKGELVLHYNELIANPYGSNSLNPVVWFVLWKNGCPQGMSLNDDDRDTLQNIFDVVENYNTENEENINVFPNPFDNYFDIISKNSDILTVLTMEGKIIKKVAIDKGLSRITTSYFPRGVYLLRLENQGCQLKMIKL